MSRSPLFQVMFVLRNTPTAVLELPGIQLGVLNAESGSAKFDLMLSMAEVTDGLVGWFEYNTDLFETATIQRMFGHFETLLEAIVADTGQAVSEMPLLTAAEQRRLLVEWNDNGTGYTGDACIHDRFEAQARRAPDATAVVFGEEEISYGELNQRANQLAHHLQSLGVGPETLVGICVERSVEMIVGLFGILKAGGAYVPLDPFYPAQRLALMLEDSQALVLLTQQRLNGALGAHDAKVVNIDSDWDVIARNSAGNPLSDVHPSNTGYVIYTSGSTGRPKGVVIEHRSTVAMIDWATGVFTADELSSVLASTSICFDISTFELFVTLSVGGQIVLTENALHLRSLPDDVDISLINTVPSAMAELVRMGALPGSVRTVNLAGEPLQNRLAQEIYENENIKHVYNLYGPTEDTTYSTFALVKKDAQQAPPIGRPLANSQAYILDQRMQPVPVGVAGELFLGGAGVTRGYLRRPELTAERYIPDPFSEEPGARLYRTGDLTRYLSDGTIEYLGRMDHQVKIRGFRIELGEIQTALAEHAAIQDCAVLAREDQPGDKRLVAYVVFKSDSSIAIAELRDSLKERLPDYMVPSHFVVLDELPLTPNGKLNRRALPAPVASRDSLAQTFTAPRSPLEELLASIFSDLLAVERVGIDDNFFELGGHSLLATQLISRIRAAFQVELPLRTVFESATVAALSARIEQEKQSGAESLRQLERVVRTGAIPLSFAQQRLWFLHQLEPASAVYNMPAAVRLSGSLNSAALEATLTEIVRRHESLRTTFTYAGEQPCQVIREAESWSLSVIDVSALAERERGAEVERLAEEEARRPFDLQVGPLLRTTLVKVAEAEHVLLWTMHHIISDGWSMGVLLREVAAIYEAYVRGAASPLPELPIQYADYAVWQREALNSEVVERQLAYWRKQLSGELPVLELPTDYVRPAVQTFSGAVEQTELSSGLSNGLRELSRREGATLYMVLLAAFKVLLSRYTGQEEIIVGSPIAGRNRVETEGLIGFFLNTLVLRTDLSGEPTFQRLLARVNEVTIGAYTHQDVPFEKLLEELNPERRRDNTPVFQVLFNMLNFPSSEISLPGLKIESQTALESGSKFDLTLYVHEEENIRFTLVYNPDLFKPERMVEMLDQFRHVLAQVSGNPSIEIKRLSLVTPRAAKLLPQPTQPIHSRWHGAVHQLFAEHARRSPDRIAVIDKQETWTYGQLEERSNQLANYLIAWGIQRQDVVAIYAHRSATLVWAIYGVLKAGGTFLILDPAYPELRLINYLKDANTRYWLQLEEAGALPSDLKDFVERLSCCAHMTLQSRAASEAQSFLLSSSIGDTGVAVGTGDTLSQYPVNDPSVEVGPDDIACITFTSGSTGRPKGVLGKHLSLTLFASWAQPKFGIDEHDRFSMLSGIGHDPLQRDIFTPLQLGASLSIPDPKKIGTHGWLARWMKQEGITVTNLTPAMGQLVSESAGDDELSSLRYAFFVGEMLTRHDVAKLKKLAPSVASINLYGTTETQRAVSFYAQEPAKETLPVGRGIDGVQLLVLNVAQGLAGIGELGEIYFRSPYLARGYHEDDELTRQRFITNPFTGLQDDRLYKSGDVGRYLPDGNVEMLGRMDDQVQIRGFRVELGEIRASIAAHPAIKDCAILTREDRLVAYLVFKTGASANNAELRGLLKKRLPDYMVPSHFVVLDELPLTPNGKLNRRALPAPVASRDSLSQTFTAPRSPREELLASIFSDLLAVERIGIDDNFFELGGHSLLATQLISRIRAAFQVELPLRTVFESATVAGLSARIEHEKQGESLRPLEKVSRVGAIPLSFAQQRLWFLHQLEPASAVYNMPAAVRLNGSLNIAALEATLTEIVRRHESLRTTFAYADEQPCQVIRDVESWSLPVIDVSALAESERGAEVERLAEEEARRSFDLQAGPLLRTTLVQIADQEHVLLWTMHHIISDGWSMGVVIREVAAIYEAFVRGAASPLPELPIQYADYAVWQRETLNSDVVERQLAYWRKQLGGELPVLELPTDHVRPAVQTFRGAVEQVSLSRELSDGLRTVSKRTGATLYMVLLAAFNVLLSRYTGQEEIIVGSPIAGRNRVETEGLIGFFVNTLVFRSEVRGEESFAEVVKRVREVVLEGHTHQDVPFEKLVEELKPKRDFSRSPLFQIAFMFQSAGEKELASSGLSLSMLQSHAGASKFDVTLSLVDDGQELNGTLEYNTDLYDATTIERLAANFKTLLKGVVVNHTQRVSELPVLTAIEETRVVTEWNQTLKAYDKESCIHQLFEAQVERTPESLALVFEDKRVTYAELNRRANQLAHHLQTLGVGAETLVGICVERSIEMVVGLLGILKAGGAYVPLDPSYPAQRLAMMLEDSGIKVLLTQQHLLKSLPPHEARVVCVDDDLEAIARNSEENPSRNVTTRNLAYVIFTSGSTGRPKGVQIEHAAVVNFLTSMRDEPGLTSDDVLLAVTSLSFDIAGLELFLPLVVGAREVLVSREVASDGTQLRERLNGITAMQATPATYRLLLNAGCDDLSGVKILCGGEAFPRELANQLIEKGATVWNMYGPTESTIWSAVSRVEVKDGAVAIGRPITNTQIYLLDAQLRPVPIGVAGELFIGGDGLTRGYLNRPDLTAEKMVPSPFDEKGGARLYRTGDLARFLPDGNIEFMSRIDHQVKVRGHRIELGEIEVALGQHGAVDVCVVMAREDVPGDRRLVAYIVPATTMPAPTVSELRSFLSDRLPEYMIPSNIVVLEAFPLTPNGKIDRRALPVPDGERPTLEAPFVAPRSDLERGIASVWQEVLQVSKVGIHDNFFDLGGHSLMLVQIHGKLRAQLQRDLSVVEMFRYPTVNALAKHLGQPAQTTSANQVNELNEKLTAGKKRLQKIFKQERRGNGNRHASAP
ncbi:MAG TPA: amino acid adenylation domain-containing protein [Pyrinomonadaceae bacterium]